MRPRIVFTIFKKEIVDTLRDRRTLFAMFILPVMLYPILFSAMGAVAASSEAQRKGFRPTVMVWGALPTPARTALKAEFGAELVEEPLPDGDREQRAREKVESHQADLVVSAPPEARARFDADEAAPIDLYYDAVASHSAEAKERAEKKLEAAAVEARTARIAKHKLPADFDKPFSITAHEFAGKARRGGDVAGHVLPFILVFVMVLAGLLPAVDLTAGEKERGTLQTLLTAPVRPVEIVAGKYLTVVALSIAGAAANLGAMTLTLQRQLAAIGKGAVEFHLSIGTGCALFIAMLPCALLFAAILLALAVFARSFREANAYLSPIMLVLSFPAVIALIPGVELDAVTAFVPVVNLSLVIRELLRGTVSPTLYFLACTANLIYATLAVLFAARVFETEQVLLGGEKPWRDLVGDKARTHVTPSPRQAVFFVATLIVVIYYGALWMLQRQLRPIQSLAFLQIGLLLIPALLFIRASKLSFKETLLLRVPRARAIAGGILLAAGAWAIGGAIQTLEAHLFPGAKAYYELFNKALGDVAAPLPVLVIVIAVLPAIAEEVCFRGIVLSGFSNTGKKSVALFASAALFGLFHLNPHHAIAAFALGMLFGYAALESRSILPGMLAHFVNNVLAVLLLRVPSAGNVLGSVPAMVIASACAVVGLYLVRGSGLARTTSA